MFWPVSKVLLGKVPGVITFLGGCYGIYAIGSRVLLGSVSAVLTFLGGCKGVLGGF